MFMTVPSFEQQVPQGLGPQGARFWGALTLSSGLHWYLLTHRVTVEGAFPIAQTIAVSWESTLREMLEEIGAEAVISAHVVTPGERTGHWLVARIAEVWQASTDEEHSTGPLLFRVHGEAGLSDSHRRRTSDAAGKRRLLAQCA